MKKLLLLIALALTAQTIKAQATQSLSTNLIYNGDFTNGTTGWYFSSPGTVVNQEAYYSFTNSGGSFWDTQLYQMGMMSFTNGTQYKLTFRARAAANRNITVAILDPEGGYRDIFKQNYALTTTMETYTSTFTTSSTYSNVYISFWMAALGSTSGVYFDDVSIVVPSEPQPIIGALTVPNKVFGDAPFNLTAPTSNSDGPFTYTSNNTAVATISGSTVTIVGYGSSTITANQAATGSFDTGSVSATLTVGLSQPTVNAPTPPSKLATDIISIYSDSYTNIATDYKPNWGQSGTVNTTYLPTGSGTNFVMAYTNFNWQGTSLPLINASGMEYLHVDIWTGANPAKSFLTVSPLNNGTGSSQINVPINYTSGSWTSVDIPKSYFTGQTWDSLYGLFFIASEAGSVSPIDIYLDNVYFWKINPRNVVLSGTAVPGGQQILNTVDGINYIKESVTFVNAGTGHFNEIASNLNPSGPYGDWSSVDFSNGTGILGGADIAIQPGTYNLSLNISTGIYAFTPITVSVIGDFNSSASDVEMTTTDNITYTLSNYTFSQAGGLKFRDNHNWNFNYGAASTTVSGTGTGVFNSGTKINYTVGTFDITFNRTTLQYNFKEHKAYDDQISLLEGATATSLITNATSVLANDTLAPNSTAVLVSVPTNGTLLLNSDGTFSYTHNNSKMLSDSFTYKDYNGISYSNIATVTINVTEVNINPPTNISLSNATINENLNNTSIGNLSATDLDSNNVFTYSLVSGNGDTGNSNFAIVNGNQLRNVTPFDFETQPSYSIRVKVNDGAGNNFEKVFTINIMNVNDIAIMATPVNSYCSGSISINTVTNTSGVVHYSWTASNGGVVQPTEQNTANITNLPNGTYTITITDDYSPYSQSFNITTLPQYQNTSVCYVTSDETDVSKNRIYINNQGNYNVGFYEILRESNVSNYYTSIGTISPSETSFLDLNSNNTSKTYRYKVRLVDNCGNNSPVSASHKTILLLSSIAINNTVNLSWTNYEGISYGTYNIYRRTNLGAFELIDSMASSENTYNDNTANILNNNYEYYISIAVNSCSTSSSAKLNNKKTALNSQIRSNYQIISKKGVDPSISTLTYCTGATIATAKGSKSLNFYTTASGGTSLAATTPLTTRTLYMTETINGIESIPRVAKSIVVGLPATAGTITTPDNLLCKYVGQTTPLTFTTPEVAGATYVWSVPTGVNIISGSETNTLTVNLSGVSQTVAGAIGNIGVKIINAAGCVSAAEKKFALTTKNPAAPTKLILTSKDTSLSNLTTITKVGPYMGTSTVFTLKATDISNTANHYRWDLPTSVTQLSGGTSNEITVDFANVSAGTGSLAVRVYSVGGCGESTTAKTLTLSRALPTKPSALTLTALTSNSINLPIGTADKISYISPYVGKSTVLTLVATPIATQGATATSYEWVFPAGVHSFGTTAKTVGEVTTISSVSNIITVDFSDVQPAVLSLPISVYAVNGVGKSLIKTLTLTSRVPATPGSITTTALAVPTYNPACSNTITVKVPTVFGVSNIWTVGSGATITSGQGTNSIVINVSGVTTTKLVISVIASNGTGSSAAKTLSIYKVSTCRISTEEAVSENFKVVGYPNPSSSEFTIDVQSSSKGKPFGVQVYDVLGRLIEEQHTKEFNMKIGANYQSGTYILKVSQGENQKTLQVIKK